MLVAVVGCSSTEVSDKQPGLPSTCARDLYAGFATPQEAFATYAQALNEGDYCRAANTYARAQRSDLATTSFTALIFTAGTTDRNPEAYRARLFKLCEQYGLGCGSDARVVELVHAMRAGKSIQSLEPKLAAVAQQVPEDVFSEVMKTLAAVDPSAIGRLSTTPKDLVEQGDRATALGERAGRPGTPVKMIKGAQGWTLALR